MWYHIYMKYVIDGNEYEVVIQKKNNKNSYIRVKDDMTILVTTGFFTTKKQVVAILKNNEDIIKKMILKKEVRKEIENSFYYLGNKYDVIIMNGIKKVEFSGHYVYTESIEALDKWYKNEAKTIFLEHLNNKYNLFEESIPYPKLKIRKMKTRWGVCNKRDNSVTLNLDLMKYDLRALDYVIIHELSHFVHFNHSSSFWALVSKYEPNYKEIKKMLNNE